MATLEQIRTAQDALIAARKARIAAAVALREALDACRQVYPDLEEQALAAGYESPGEWLRSDGSPTLPAATPVPGGGDPVYRG